MDLMDYNSTWITPTKKHNDFYASLHPKIQSQKDLNSTLHAHNHKMANHIYDHNFFDYMAHLNTVVDRNEGGIVEAGVFIGDPTKKQTGGSIPGKFPLPGTDTATNMYSGNAVNELVDALSMGGFKPPPKGVITDASIRNRERINRGGKMLKVPRTDFHDPKFKKGGNILKTIGRVAKKTAVGVLDFHNYMLSLGLDIGEQAAGPLGGIAGAAAFTAMGQPELAPIGAAIGTATGYQVGKRARRGMKYYTGLGKMTAGSNGINLDEKDIEKAIRSLAKFVNGQKKSKPSSKHLKILLDAGLIQDEKQIDGGSQCMHHTDGGNILSTIKRTGKKLIDHQKDQYNMVKTNMKDKVIPLLEGTPEFYRGVFTGKPKEALKKNREITRGSGKNNTWVNHVKNYAKTHNLTYKEALSKSKSSYKN